jgi:hypothetical protein
MMPAAFPAAPEVGGSDSAPAAAEDDAVRAAILSAFGANRHRRSRPPLCPRGPRRWAGCVDGQQITTLPRLPLRLKGFRRRHTSSKTVNLSPTRRMVGEPRRPWRLSPKSSSDTLRSSSSRASASAATATAKNKFKPRPEARRTNKSPASPDFDCNEQARAIPVPPPQNKALRS